MDRRTFVRGAVVASAAAAATAAGVAAWKAARPRPVEVHYAARAVGGPAPRGVPLLPLRVDEDGHLVGAPLVEGPRGPYDVLRTFRFCARQDVPALASPSSAVDDVLRFSGKRESGFEEPPWFAVVEGTAVRAEDIQVGLAARAHWRSSAADAPYDVQVVLQRFRKDEIRRWSPSGPRYDNPGPDPRPLTDDEFGWILQEVFLPDGDDVLVCASALCTHFCCVAGIGEARRLAASRDSADKLFCTCHFAIFDLREPVAYAIDGLEDVPAPDADERGQGQAQGEG